MAVNTRGQLMGSIKGEQKVNGSIKSEQKVKGSASVGRPVKGIDVTGAEIGQIIRVAEVDENGKPTKWEATDMPDLNDAVKSVNSIEPDENGNVEIDTMPDGLEQIAILAEADMLPAIHDASGAILTDENGNVILRY